MVNGIVSAWFWEKENKWGDCHMAPDFHWEALSGPQQREGESKQVIDLSLTWALGIGIQRGQGSQNLWSRVREWNKPHSGEKKKSSLRGLLQCPWVSWWWGGGGNYIVHSNDQLSKVRERAAIRGFVRLTISRDHIVPTTQVERTHWMYRTFRKELRKFMH